LLEVFIHPPLYSHVVNFFVPSPLATWGWSVV
jgi:hypothetical protein